MKLDEFIKLIESERETTRLTNLEKIATIVKTQTEKEKN